MDFLKNGWNTVLGNQPNATQPSVSETIEKLIERVESSILLEDRRDACRALKSLSKVYQLEVGAKGMDTLINVLKLDRNDIESLSFTLDALNNIISGPQDDCAEDNKYAPTEDLSLQFTEIFTKKKDNIALVLDVLIEYDFKVLWPSIKLLMTLLRNKRKKTQEAILANPVGVSRLMEILRDNREIIRNEAILLLRDLTRGNTNIQKIVVFENAFDILLEIIAYEGYSDGGVVVEDCLIVLQNLLRNNTSNQNYFKEGSYIQRLLPFIDMTLTTDWTPQKITNVLFLFQVIRALVSPTNPVQVNKSCQKIMFSIGALRKLCNILILDGIPVDIRTQAINTVAEIIRGDFQNQEFFKSVNEPITSPKPLIISLLESMINEKQLLEFRCSVLYCFQCFLYRNECGQAQIIEAFTSSKETPLKLSSKILLMGLFSNDSLSNWFASISLSHALIDNEIQKKELLKVLIPLDEKSHPLIDRCNTYTSNDKNIIPLFDQCCILLQESSKLQTRIGLLMLICTWLSECQIAVSRFLKITTNVPYLTSHFGLLEGDDLEILIQGLCAFLLGVCVHYNDDSVESFTRNKLCQFVDKRIGIDTFSERINYVSKSDKFSSAAQKPQIKSSKKDDITFDYEFCRLFRSLEVAVIKAARSNPMDMPDEHKELLTPYQKLIRDLTEENAALKNELSELKQDEENRKKEIEELNSKYMQLKDTNDLLILQNSNSKEEELRKENKRLLTKIKSLECELNAQLRPTKTSIPETSITISDEHEEIAELRMEKQALTECLKNMEQQLYKVMAEKGEQEEELKMLKFEKLIDINTKENNNFDTKEVG